MFLLFYNDHVVEWSKATVCKTGERKLRVGSNPTMVTNLVSSTSYTSGKTDRVVCIDKYFTQLESDYR